MLKKKKDDELLIYPNPVNNGYFNIDISDKEIEVKSLKIYDMNGSLVSKFNLSSPYRSLVLDGLKDGVYMFVFTTRPYNILTKKVVVE